MEMEKKMGEERRTCCWEANESEQAKWTPIRSRTNWVMARTEATMNNSFDLFERKHLTTALDWCWGRETKTKKQNEICDAERGDTRNQTQVNESKTKEEVRLSNESIESIDLIENWNRSTRADWCNRTHVLGGSRARKS